MVSKAKEEMLEHALHAMSRDPNLSLRRAARLYGVAKSTLLDRSKGTRPRDRAQIKMQLLTDIQARLKY
jgi:hypothetical protein